VKAFRSRTASPVGLISIVLIYILLILLILLFSNQLLRDIAQGESFPSRIIIPLGVAVPGFLIAAVIFNIVRLVRERRANRPGVRFKIRLILFFTFIAFLSSIPQTILSISFIDTTLNSWFSSRIGDALEGGVHIALTYYNEEVEELRTLANSPVLKSLLRTVEYRPDQAWTDIRSINSSVRMMQVYDDDGREIAFFGDPEGRSEVPEQKYPREGMIVKESFETMTMLKIYKLVEYGEMEYNLVLGSVLSENFDEEARQLTDSLETFKQLERYRTIFRVVLILFYSFFSVPILLLTILVSFLLSDEIIRPVVNLEEATKRVAEGDFSTRILSRSNDELSALSQSFNSMVSELEKSRKIILQTEKVTAWQEIAQRMAHEIKNPLTPIRLSAERILRKYRTDPEGLEGLLEQAVGSIVREVENLNTLLGEFRDFARLPSPDLSPVPLASILDSTVESFASSYPGVAIDTSGFRDCAVMADKKQLSQAFYNLLKNAVDAMNEKGKISVSSSLVTKGNLRYCRIQLQDTGAGIPEEDWDQVFNPYFTTKPKGTGLGLPIVERIIFDHKGYIWFETESGVGTTFFIDLPAADTKE
jgi:nitrogen fixation/metabolism regulation signal transduction histidine kinase